MTAPDSSIAELGTILSVWAHPDDETYLAGGVMAAAVDAGQRVVCVLTGHELKDADATVNYHLGEADTALRGRLSNRPLDVDDDLESICRVIESTGRAVPAAARRAGK